MTIHCPACATPTTYDTRCMWHYCWRCGIGLGAEVIAKRKKTRLGRLWLAAFTR